MALIGALRYKTDMICDLAETYGVLDYRALTVPTLAALCAGLRDTSRIHMRYSGRMVSADRLIMASAADCLAFLMWGLTSFLSGAALERPPSFVEELLGIETATEAESDIIAFNTPDEFNAARRKMMGVSANGR